MLELRAHYGPGFRIYFAEQGSDVIILLTGGDKSSQNYDIIQAKKFWKDYKKEKKDDDY